MQDFSFTPYIYAYSYFSKETNVRTILNLCKRSAKFIDKLKPCEYYLTNWELKKQTNSTSNRNTSMPYNIPSDNHFRYIITYRTQWRFVNVWSGWFGWNSIACTLKLSTRWIPMEGRILILLRFKNRRTIFESSPCPFAVGPSNGTVTVF